MTTYPLTSEQQAQLDVAQLKVDRANQLLQEFKTIIDIMRKEFPAHTFGLTKRQIEKENSIEKVLERVHHAAQLTDRLVRRFQAEAHARHLAEKKKQDELIQQAKSDEQDKLSMEAIIWIQQNHPTCKLGQDFTIHTAIDCADDLAYDDEVIKMRHSKIWHSFVGQNCSENEQSCQGWDGYSKRCECGNRRVYWEPEHDHSFKHPHIVAQAY